MRPQAGTPTFMNISLLEERQMAIQTEVINEDRLNAFMGQVVGELGATVNAGLIVIGDRVGLYKAMASAGPMTSAELAEKTDTAERYVREWLNAQAAGGFVEYNPETQRYLLPPEQAMALANEDSPAFVCGAFELATATLKSGAEIESAFRSGAGFGWHEHDPGVATGCERFFRPGYNDHPESIELARKKANDGGLQDRARFEVGAAAAFPGSGYDLIAMFDCLHDMGDPVGAARHVRQALAPDGTWLIVEPYASDTITGNLTPIGRAYHNFSTLLCVPNAMSQAGGYAIGAQAGEAAIRQLVTDA